MASEKVRIELDSTADTSGVDKMGRAVAGVAGGNKLAAESAYDAAKGSKDMARGLGEGAAAGNAAVSAMSQLSTATQGGAGGFIAIARAAFSAGVAFKSVLASMGPLGLIAAGIGVAMGVMSLALKSGEDAAEATKKKIDELNKAKLDALTQQEKALTEATKEATAAIDKQLEAADKLADMRTARLIEEEKARGKTQGIAPEITDRNIARIRRDAEDAKIGRQQSALEQKAEVLGDSAVEAEQKALDEEAKRNLLLAAKARRDAAKKEADDATTSYMNAMAIPGGTGDNARDQQIIDRYNSANDELAAAQKAYAARVGGADKSGELYNKSLETADAALKATKEAAAVARKAADDATAAAADARKQESGLAPERAKLRNAENANAAQQTPEQKAAIEKAKAKKQAEADWRMGELGAPAVAGRIASGDTTFDIEDARKKFPGYKFTAPAGQQSAATQSPNVTQLGGGALPYSQPGSGNQAGFGALQPGAVDQRNQVTRGQLKPGSDTKQGAITQPLQDAAKAMKEAPTGDAAAKAAQDLKAATETATQAQIAANEQTVAAFTDMLGMSQTIVDTLTPIPPQISAIRSEIQKLWGAVRSAGRKSNVA